MSDFEKEMRYHLIDNGIKLSSLAKQMGISRAAAYYAIGGTSGYDKIREKMIAYFDEM